METSKIASSQIPIDTESPSTALPSPTQDELYYIFPSGISYIELYRGGGDIFSPTPPPFCVVDDSSQIEKISHILNKCKRNKTAISGLGLGTRVATFEMRLSNSCWLYFIKAGKNLYFNTKYNYADLYAVPTSEQRLFEHLIGCDSDSSPNFLTLDAPLATTLNSCHEAVYSSESNISIDSQSDMAERLIQQFLNQINSASPFRTFYIEEYSSLNVQILCNSTNFFEYKQEYPDIELDLLQDNEWIVVCTLKAKIVGYYDSGENYAVPKDENGFSDISIHTGILKYYDGKYIFFPRYRSL